MTYRQEMGRLARELGRLLIDGGRVPEYDLSDAIGTVHRGLPSTVHNEPAEDPSPGIATLGYSLAGPKIINIPSDIAVVGPTASETGQRWRNVAEGATSARREWHLSTERSRPAGKSAWSEIADMATIGEAIGLLDTDIADSLAEACRWPEASALRASQPNLLDTARQIQHLASAEALPVNPDLKPAFKKQILLIPTQEALPGALKQLRELILTSYDLPPAQLETISRVTAETALATAAALRQPGDPAPAALREHARRLSAVMGLSQHIAPQRLGKGKAAAQAQHIHHTLRNLHLRGTTLSPRVAHEAALALTPITRALTFSASEQISAGSWLISRNQSEPVRRDASLGSGDEPRLLSALRHADEHRKIVNDALGQGLHQAPARPPPIPRKVLAAPLALRNSTAPSIRPQNASKGRH